ncbi:DNA-binding protein SMUBP-2-like [Acanthaster planci]|uniref:DNA-binding protein SMUBP-2-like n=1 Tax=Acanthaster planci TaxID=133434 RepID=A0A8B7YN41_ACAPL|nr:DNA-binding protein SMUBP-2-like [Acanthaster planci]
MAVREFIKKQSELLALEREAEIAETSALAENVPLKELQRRGVCLLKLHPASQSTGLYGRTLVTFAPRKGHGDGTLPTHNISSGDIVGVSPSHGGGASSTEDPSGIVSRVTQSSITVAFDHKDTEGPVTFEYEGLYRLTKLANDVTYRRLKRSLSDLDACSSSQAHHLVDVLFGEADVSPPSLPLPQPRQPAESAELQFFNENLDRSQREAVTFALGQRDVAIIHGPPGTGKTTTIVEIIRQAVKQKLKVLACAPSNVAVDNLVERLAAGKVHIVRLGHPARLLHSIQRYALDAILASSEEAGIVRDVRKEIDQTRTLLSKTKQAGEKRRLRDEARTLRKELREREQHAVQEILQRADVVLATNTGASPTGPLSHLPREHFDLAVVDECAQALEAGCWIPLLLAPRCVLAGDHQQLPPTILSDRAAADGLAVSLMERAVKLHDDKITRMLTTQYRMNSAIMRWSSDALYDGKLAADESVARHLLKDLPGVEQNEDTSLPLLLIDTAGCGLEELDLESEVSKGNEGEADLVAVHIERLLDSGVPAWEIAVIAPYNLQVELLRLRLSGRHPDLEIKSVDGFQGREKEAVVISLVRSNSKGEVGFLAEDRRINVAVTRARRHVAVICDSDTIRHHGFLKNLVEYMEANGEVRSAFQYQDEIDLSSSDAPRPDYLKFRQSKPSIKKDKGAKPKQPRPKEKRHHTSDTKTRSFDPEVSAKREAELTAQVQSFAKDRTADRLAFPPTLNSHDRLVVHQAAEQLGLYHSSIGEGRDRHIIISSQPIRTDVAESKSSSHGSDGKDSTDSVEEKLANVHVDAVLEELRTENLMDVIIGADHDGTDVLSLDAEGNVEKENTDLVNVRDGAIKDINCQGEASFAQKARPPKQETKSSEEATDLHKCKFCKKKLPPGSVLLHEIHCEKKMEEKRRLQEVSKTKKKTDKSKQRNALEHTTEEDFDKLIALAVESDNRCNFVRCAERIALTGVRCAFCNRRYCFGHAMPEVHGCGEMARAHARKVVHREKEVWAGSGTRERKVDPTRRAQLERKLEKKRGEMEEKRTRKSAKKK